LLPSYFSEIGLRCHSNKVSGVTMVATSANTCRPQHLGSHRQPASLVVVKSQSTVVDLSAQNPVFFAKIFDDLQLFLVHPPGNGDEQHPERIQSSWHLCRVSSSSHASLNAVRAGIFPAIEFLDVTGSRGVKTRADS